MWAQILLGEILGDTSSWSWLLLTVAHTDLENFAQDLHFLRQLRTNMQNANTCPALENLLYLLHSVAEMQETVPICTGTCL